MTTISAEPDNDPSSHLYTIPKISDALNHVYGGWKHIQLPHTRMAGKVALQGCLPLLMEESSAEELVQRIGQEKYEQLRSIYRESSLLNMWYSWELKQVLEALTAAKVLVMILKGGDIATSQYPRSELRHFHDIDLMVHPEDMVTTVAILEGLGYSYYQEYRFEAISKHRAAFVYAKKEIIGYLVFEIHTSFHSNEMGVSFVTQEIWERARAITIAGISVFSMGLEDLLLYLCWHYRSHVFSRLIWLYDIAIVLQRCGDRLDWELVHKIARERRLTTTLYYCIGLCQQMFRITVLERAQIDTLMPPVLIQRLITRLIGNDLTNVLHRTAYRERKLLQYLMADNIVALCLIGLRAVVPSRTHLGRLYMENSILPVNLFWIYYFLHPLFLLKAFFCNRRESYTEGNKRISHV